MTHSIVKEGYVCNHGNHGFTTEQWSARAVSFGPGGVPSPFAPFLAKY